MQNAQPSDGIGDVVQPSYSLALSAEYGVTKWGT